MHKLDLIVIGASAGGVEGLISIVERLPVSAPPIVIVLHTSRDGDSYLPKILSRRTPMPVKFAEANDHLSTGRLLVAPPDFHVLIRDGRIALNRGPRENGFRPAIDPLFRTAAATYGRQVMGVILSGALDDGAYGMKVLADLGGVTVVQSPDDARVPTMPRSVMKIVDVDYVLPAVEIGDLIASTTKHFAEEVQASNGARAMTRPKDPEPQDVSQETEVKDMLQRYGPPSGLTCPDCGGALWEIPDGKLVRYRCHVGHQFSPEGLDAQQSDAVEAALWSAVRVLEEHTELRLRLAERSDAAGLERVSSGFRASADQSHQQASSIRELLFGRSVPEPPKADETVAITAAVPKANGRGQKTKARNPRTNGRGTRKHGKRVRRT